MKMIGAPPIAASAASLATCGSEADISEPAGAAASGVEHGGDPAEKMPATAPGADAPASAADAATRAAMRQTFPASAIGGRAFALAAALGLAACGANEPGLSTADIVAQAEAHVREELELSERAALFTDVFIPGYEDGELMVCGNVSGSRPGGPPIAPRRFIVQLDPVRWVAWEAENSPHRMPAGFAAAWTEICRNPDDTSKVPLVPQ